MIALERPQELGITPLKALKVTADLAGMSQGVTEGCLLFIGCIAGIHALRQLRVRRALKFNGDFNVDDVPVLTDEMLSFYRRWTGEEEVDLTFIISNWRSLKQKFHTFRCIQGMMYLNPRARRLSGYARLLESIASTEKTRGQLKVADAGACFGQDVRQLILDGVPATCITAFDLHDGYWKAGLELFKDEKSSKLDGVKAIFFDLTLPHGHPEAVERTHPSEVASYDFIILQAVLHTLSLDEQRSALARLCLLLKRGGVLIGATGGSDTPQSWFLTPNGKAPRYLQSPSSLRALLLDVGFSQADTHSLHSWGVGAGSPGGARLSLPADAVMKGRILVEFAATK